MMLHRNETHVADKFIISSSEARIVNSSSWVYGKWAGGGDGHELIELPHVTQHLVMEASS